MESHGKGLLVKAQQLSLCKESDFEFFFFVLSICIDLIDSWSVL